MNKERIRKIITVIILISLAGLISYGSINNYYKEDNKNLIDFCTEHYRNESFMDLFSDNEPYILKICFDEGRRNNCTEITNEQLRFSDNCGWGMKDYLLLLLLIGGGFCFPLCIIGIAIGVLISKDKVEENE